jgi:hypothetical protein
MAINITADKKAKFLKDWATGKWTERELQERHKVSKSTCGRWLKEVRSGPVNDHPKLNRYMDSLERFSVAAMDMLTSHAELWSDKDYLRNQTADDAIKQRESIMSQLERFIRLHRPLPVASESHSLPERSGSRDAIVPELVEEDGA